MLRIARDPCGQDTDSVVGIGVAIGEPGPHGRLGGRSRILGGENSICSFIVV